MYLFLPFDYSYYFIFYRYIISRDKGVVKSYFKFSFRILMSTCLGQKERQIWNLPHSILRVVDLSEGTLSKKFQFLVAHYDFHTVAQHPQISFLPWRFQSRFVAILIPSPCLPKRLQRASISENLFILNLRSFYTLPRLEFLYLVLTAPLLQLIAMDCWK